MGSSISTVLLDADGVVQTSQRVLNTLNRLLLGRATLDELMVAESRAIVGTEDLRDVLAEFVAGHGIATTPDEFLTAWCDTEPDLEVLDLVGRVRHCGTPVYLATNQQPVRGRWLRDELGYDKHFDRLFISCEMGVAKPATGYFEYILGEIGAEAAHTLFVDDVESNVEGARSAGLVAEWHDPASGVRDVERIFDRYSIDHSR